MAGAVAALALGAAWGALGPPAVWARAGLAAIRFRGALVRAPASWPVYRLAKHPRVCVRLDRPVVYLGTPGASQRCPAGAIGRRRAVLVDPGAAARASAAPGGVSALISAAGQFAGRGFDACSTPSSRAMSSWASSPYRAIGVYIGGVNRACSQPNLTPAWVGSQLAAGWHLIPTYVGLQAPTSSCGSCAKLSAAKATAQGTAAAEDAVAQAQSVAIGRGSPIYFDMEAYTRTSGATRATLAFLLAWTSQLHALGYLSGVYSSSASGIADLAGELETGYVEPDDIWIANWNGRESTADPFVPATAWSPSRRIHQFEGAHDESYGGVRINIDGDYVDAATAGPAAPPPNLPPLTISRVRGAAGKVIVGVRCGRPSGEVCPGEILLRAYVRVRQRVKRRASVSAMAVRVGIARRAFRLGAGRSHTFQVGLNARGRSLLAAKKRGMLKAQLLVVIPGARASQAVELRSR